MQSPVLVNQELTMKFLSLTEHKSGSQQQQQQQSPSKPPAENIIKLEPKTADADNLHHTHDPQTTSAVSAPPPPPGPYSINNGYLTPPKMETGYLTPPKIEPDSMATLGHTVSSMTSSYSMTSPHMTSAHMAHQHVMTSPNNYLLPPSPPKAVPVVMDDAYAARHHLLHNEAVAAAAQAEAHAHAPASSMHMQTSEPSSLHTVPVGAS